MDKKMAKVSKGMKKAISVLKKDVKENVKLTKEDREIRDPEIKAYKKMKKKGC